ncbi:PAS domain-containing protein [Leptothrix ochracea]|uniref:PAS domain-containing protein n=1 Tax=Leptothrix ochracea TaxID=735331 RepID=UPI0002E4CEBE
MALRNQPKHLGAVARYKALLGYSEHELDGLDAQAFIQQAHPEDRPRLQAIWAACHQGETVHHETTLRLLHKDGHEMPVCCACLSDGMPKIARCASSAPASI